MTRPYGAEALAKIVFGKQRIIKLTHTHKAYKGQFVKDCPACEWIQNNTGDL